MSILRTLWLLIIVVVGISVGYLVYTGYIPLPAGLRARLPLPVTSQAPNTETATTSASPAPQKVLSQLNQLGAKLPSDIQLPPEINQTLVGIYENAQSFSTQAAQVLGTAIEATSSGTPLHQQAFEYGKYMYCKQVVETWEKNSPTTTQ